MQDYSLNNDHTKQVKSFRKETVKEQNGILNRLKSIHTDSLAIPQFHQSIAPHFPILANKRCGQWYVQPSYPKYTLPRSSPQSEPTLQSTPQVDHSQQIPTSTCYFKSTDGHFGTWNFPESRLNLNVLEALFKPHTALNLASEITNYAHSQSSAPTRTDSAQYNSLEEKEMSEFADLNLSGLIIVDSTRKGKKFPDSFSRTVPIWCGVMNQAFGGGYNPAPQTAPTSPAPYSTSTPDLTFTSPPWMSGSETDQIIEKIRHNHIGKLQANLGKVRCEQYSEQFHQRFSSDPQRVTIRSNNDDVSKSIESGTTQFRPSPPSQQHFQYFTPIWLHRETYESSVQIMNENLYMLFHDHLFPIIFAQHSTPPTPAPAQLQASTLPSIQPDSLFISSFLHHIIFKYNLALYLTITRYYNTQPDNSYLNSIISHFHTHFASTLATITPLALPIPSPQSPTIVDNNASPSATMPKNYNHCWKSTINHIITIFTLLRQFFTTPIILFSVSYIYRHNLTYAGTNTGVYKGNQGEIEEEEEDEIDDSDSDHDFELSPDIATPPIKLICPYEFTKLPSFQAPRIDSPRVVNQTASTIRSNHPLIPFQRTDLSTLKLNNKDNQCKDLNYIPGAGDDEETWAKKKVWVLKSRSELHLDDSNSQVDNDMGGRGSVVKQNAQNDMNTDTGREKRAVVDSDDFNEGYGEDEDDGWEYSHYDEYDQLAPIIFADHVPSKLMRCYRSVLLSCTFDMLYRDIVFTNDEEEEEEEEGYGVTKNSSSPASFSASSTPNTTIFKLPSVLPSLTSNRDCWSVIYRILFEQAQPSSNTSQSLQTQPSEYAFLQSTPIFSIKCTNSSQSNTTTNTVIFYSIDPNQALSVISQQIKYNQYVPSHPQRKPNTVTANTLNNRTNKSIVILESQSQTDPVTSKLVQLSSELQQSYHTHPQAHPSTIQSSSPTHQLHSTTEPNTQQTLAINPDPLQSHLSDLSVKFVPISVKRTVKLAFLFHLHSFLNIVYSALSPSPPSQSHANQPDQSTRFESTVTEMYLTNSTMELYFAMIIASLLFFTPKCTSAATPSNSELDRLPPPFTQLSLQSLHSQSSSTPTPTVPQYHVHQQRQSSNIDSNMGNLNPPQTLPYSLCPDTPLTHANVSKVDHSPTNVYTTNATYSKQYIRQFITHVMSSTSATIHNGIFLSRDLQQQLNQYFCHRVERPPK